MGDIIVFQARDVGSRVATRVRVKAPQGSRFDGQVGYVVKVVEETWIVRIPAGTLPFGKGELEVLP